MESDALLVARARSGDVIAWASLMRRHFDHAFVIARAICSVNEDAEDACAEAFARAWFRLAECRQPGLFRSWLMQIVRRQSLNVRRYQVLRSAVSLDDVPEPAAPGVETFTQQTHAVRVALGQLSPIKRNVVRYYHVEGWTHAQIASTLDISVFMSRRHLSDAHAQLRESLGDFKEVDSDEL